jgi:peroxiredoxin Q/BCP
MMKTLSTAFQEVLKTKGIILFFYPRANTPGCTTQACGLSDVYPQVTAAGYDLFGMSADKPKSQATWKVGRGFVKESCC